MLFNDATVEEGAGGGDGGLLPGEIECRAGLQAVRYSGGWAMFGAKVSASVAMSLARMLGSTSVQ
jgi:hypothetical protein